MAPRKLRNTIGIIVNNDSTTYEALLLNSLNTRFRNAGYQVMVNCTDGNIRWEREAFQHLKGICDCILAVSSAVRYEEIEDAVPKQIPVIFLSHKPEGCPHTAIISSDYSAVYQGVISYAGRSGRKIACVCGDTSLPSTQECLRAYRDAISVSPLEYDKELIYEVPDMESFVPRELIHDIRQEDCTALFATSPALTSVLVDYLAFHNTNPIHTPIALLGYGNFDSGLTSRMHIDLIDHPVEQIVDVAFQHATYSIHHPKNQNKRVFLLKGTLHTHTLNGLRINEE